MPKVDLFTVEAFQDMLKNPGKFYFPGHSDMGIPAFWASPPSPESIGETGTSFRRGDFWDRFGGQAFLMTG